MHWSDFFGSKNGIDQVLLNKWIQINFSIIKKELLQLQNESLQFQVGRHAWVSNLLMMKLIACIRWVHCRSAPSWQQKQPQIVVMKCWIENNWIEDRKD
jgi:hypothetical protein